MSSQTVVGFGNAASAARGSRSRGTVSLLFRGTLLGCLAGVVCLVAGVTLAWGVTPPPAVTEIPGLTGEHGLTSPVDSAFGRGGTLYVSDFIGDRVMVFDRHGSLKTVFRVEEPLALASPGDGTVYACSRADGSVARYTADGELLYYLGKGLGEFRRPIAVDVAADGRVFVVDYLKNMVKVYDAAGGYLSYIGGWGSTDGMFQAPTGLAIDPTTGEVAVVDRGGMVKDSSGNNVPVVRIQVFGGNGAFLRKFGTFGLGDGKIHTPSDLAIDDQGRLYVADTRQFCVQVFDMAGAYLGPILGVSAPIGNPTGLAFGNDRLAVTSQIDLTVFMFGIDDWVDLSVDPTSLNVTAQQLKAPLAFPVTIFNDGAGTMDWSAVGDPWIGIAPAEGSLDPDGSAEVEITPDHAGLEPGSYQGLVSVADGRGTAEEISVHLTVLAPAGLSVDPASLEFVMAEGDEDPAPQLLHVRVANDLVPPAIWNTSAQGDFLTVSEDGIVSVVGQGRTAGTYEGLVTVSSQQTVPSVIDVPVTLVIEAPPTGNVKVIANIPEAQFSLIGAEEKTALASAATRGSGIEWVYENVEPGSYTLSPGEVPRYRTPAAEDVVVVPGETTVVEVEYVRRPTDDIVVGSAASGKNDTVVRVFGPGAVFQGVSFEAFPGMAGGVNVAVADITGDGRDEIIAALTGADKNPAQIAVFDQSGAPVENTSVLVFDASRRGANVAAGDFDGDGRAEIVVGTDDEGVPTVRVLGYDGVGITDTGIMFSPLGWPAPIAVATADVDGDGTPEILAWARGGLDSDCGGIAVGNSVYVWRVSGSDLEGWSAVPAGRYLSDSGIRLMTAAAADVTGDGAADPVLVEEDGRATFVDAATGQVVRRFGSVVGRDEVVGGQAVPSAALADIDADGSLELLVGLGDHSRNRGNVNVLDGGGGIRDVIRAFPDARGATVAVGDLGDIGQEVR